jgi:NTE family protein
VIAGQEPVDISWRGTHLEPVHAEPVDAPQLPGPRDGLALCLSGGGYRAMLFHAGALWRLHELGYLQRVNRVSSVSGGSITAAVLGLRWGGLAAASAFETEVVAPLRALARKTIDLPAIVVGVLLPGMTVNDRIASAYRRHLLGDATLQDLPDEPRFVVNATSLQSGALFRFSKPFLWDYRVGQVTEPRLSLATAVAASSALPPYLSPAVLRFPAGSFTRETGQDLHREPYTRRVVLTDGGVYDNLGLETAWKRARTILVSDGGGRMKPEGRPAANWFGQGYRVAHVIDNQVRSLRKRQVIDGFRSGLRDGAYWGIRSDVADFGLSDALPCSPDDVADLAGIRTRLAALPDRLQERLVNWGYAICDTAIRRHVAPEAAPGAFPYPRGISP